MTYKQPEYWDEPIVNQSATASEPSPAPVETQACQHNSVREGTHKEDGYLVICNDCGADLSPTPGSHRNWKTIRHASEAKTSAQASESELPSIPKPITTSKHWDDGIERRIAGERAARLEREDQLRTAFQRVRELEQEVATMRTYSHETVRGLVDHRDARIADLEQELARLRDSHGKLLEVVSLAKDAAEEKVGTWPKMRKWIKAHGGVELDLQEWWVVAEMCKISIAAAENLTVPTGGKS